MLSFWLQIFGEWESVPEVPLGWGAAQTMGNAPYHYFQSAHRYREIDASTEEQFPPHTRTQYIPTPLQLLSDIVPPDLWVIKWDLPRIGASQIALDPENRKYVWFPGHIM